MPDGQVSVFFLEVLVAAFFAFAFAAWYLLRVLRKTEDARLKSIQDIVRYVYNVKH